MKKNEYKLEKKITKGMSFEEADDHTTYWENRALSERLNAACFIINQIYGVTPQTKVDRSIFERRKRDQSER
jgi:hypothetical protein